MPWRSAARSRVLLFSRAACSALALGVSPCLFRRASPRRPTIEPLSRERSASSALRGSIPGVGSSSSRRIAVSSQSPSCSSDLRLWRCGRRTLGGARLRVDLAGFPADERAFNGACGYSFARAISPRHSFIALRSRRSSRDCAPPDGRLLSGGMISSRQPSTAGAVDVPPLATTRPLATGRIRWAPARIAGPPGTGRCARRSCLLSLRAGMPEAEWKILQLGNSLAGSS